MLQNILIVPKRSASATFVKSNLTPWGQLRSGTCHHILVSAVLELYINITI